MKTKECVSVEITRLSGKRIAILATDGFESTELAELRRTFAGVGAEVQIISPIEGMIRGRSDDNLGAVVSVDVVLSDADPFHYDALYIPGGLANCDRLRTNELAIRFIQSFFERRKPVGATGHAPWLLIEAGAVNGRTLTSSFSLRTDITNAAGTWVDRETVVDHRLITGRGPEDMPIFVAALTDAIACGYNQVHSSRNFVQQSHLA